MNDQSPGGIASQPFMVKPQNLFIINVSMALRMHQVLF